MDLIQMRYIELLLMSSGKSLELILEEQKHKPVSNLLMHTHTAVMSLRGASHSPHSLCWYLPRPPQPCLRGPLRKSISKHRALLIQKQALALWRKVNDHSFHFTCSFKLPHKQQTFNLLSPVSESKQALLLMLM